MLTVNTGEALARLDGDREIYGELITAFLQDSQPDIDRLNEAVAMKDPEKSAYHAHKIKGAALTLGAERLSHHAENLEQASRKGETQDFDALFSAMEKEYRSAVEELAAFHRAL